MSLLALPLFQTKAQQLAYTPDIVLGHRSYTYLHNVSYQFKDKLKINNLTLFDTEYTKDKENIFFIRNTISYSLTNKISFHAGFGMKNPGAFLQPLLSTGLQNQLIHSPILWELLIKKASPWNNRYPQNIHHT